MADCNQFHYSSSSLIINSGTIIESSHCTTSECVNLICTGTKTMWFTDEKKTESKKKSCPKKQEIPVDIYKPKQYKFGDSDFVCKK